MESRQRYLDVLGFYPQTPHWEAEDKESAAQTTDKTPSTASKQQKTTSRARKSSAVRKEFGARSESPRRTSASLPTSGASSLESLGPRI